MNDYTNAGVSFRYEHITKANYPLYKDIDALAKDMRGTIKAKLLKKKAGKH